MVQVKQYHLPPTPLIPNSPQPLLHYINLLPSPCPSLIHETLDRNAWATQWIYRYGATQPSHYHSRIHEAMVVLSGTATIRFGVADTSPDLHHNTWGSAKEDGGVELAAQPGDVFVIPAGVAHKTFDARPAASLSLLTPGEGRGIPGPEALVGIRRDGFTMMGAYPKNCGHWDFSVGGDDVGDFRASWDVPRPERDPFLGDSGEGVVGLWRATALPERRGTGAKL
ncbi:uncharacterized protein GGS25DRAFT_532372 [Hypoxylon fragiforme]|uniref:uncharacterized protein n=1 Tax=Hypoxylon fragiforme TaxID=63214 RepID=UPI0020C6749B|nr:uncharacterized protein GGS25DRAFT_532372 [Hypoxylon fragiforme]KAI2607169.1 hypothetical protein GGS25DRAFT_532372 [Hypoxylon fragiforme]